MKIIKPTFPTKNQLRRNLRKLRPTQEGMRILFASLIILALVGLLLGTNLKTLLPGASSYEQVTIDRAQFFTRPWENALNAPYYNLVTLVNKLLIDDVLLAARTVSAIIGALTLFSFFMLLRRWFSARIAVIGVLLLVSNSWFLTVARSGTPQILLAFTPLTLFLFGSWLRTAPLVTTTFLLLCLACGISLYFPYMTWLLAIGGGIVFFKDRKKLLVNISLFGKIFGGFLIAALAVPLLISIISSPHIILELLGLGDLPDPKAALLQLLNILGGFFVATEKNPALHLGTLPLFEMFSAAMLAIGFYSYEKRLGMRRSLMVSIGFVLAIVLLSLTKDYQYNLPIILPFTMLLIISGLVELLQQWFTVFPKNPIARSLGACLMVVAIGFVSYYHLNRYFIAWPNAPETKSAYHLIQ